MAFILRGQKLLNLHQFTRIEPIDVCGDSGRTYYFIGFYIGKSETPMEFVTKEARDKAMEKIINELHAEILDMDVSCE